MSVQLVFDLQYDQRWYYRQQHLASLATSIALAPGEKLRMTIRNSQRKQLDQLTIDEVERTESQESTIIDRDVVNVARSFSKTKNWSVSGNASFSIGGFGGGVSGSLSETINQTASSSAESVSEATQKAASDLRILQKAEVREITEFTQENVNSRTITNPYRDRSLLLNVFNLAKRYCVEFVLVEMIPAVIIDVRIIDFDRKFVIGNGPFLSAALLDRELQFELTQALESLTELRDEEITAKARNLALFGLAYLFKSLNMFNVSSPLFPGTDLNDPAVSFDTDFGGFSGLDDAVNNRLAVVLTTLAFYYRLYVDQVQPDSANPDAELALELALSLDQALQPKWIAAEESQQIANVQDVSDATEVLRRLGGFLTLTNGILRPLLKPLEEEQEAVQAAKRAESVIARVVDHLNCHAAYYTATYLQFLGTNSRPTIQVFAEGLINDNVVFAGVDMDELSSRLDFESAFVSGSKVIVYTANGLGDEEVAELFDAITKLGETPPRLGIKDVRELTIPTDGVHIEPVSGNCRLPDVPPPSAQTPISVTILEDAD